MNLYPYRCRCEYRFKPEGSMWRCETGRLFDQAELDAGHGPLVYYYDEESD